MPRWSNNNNNDCWTYDQPISSLFSLICIDVDGAMDALAAKHTRTSHIWAHRSIDVNSQLTILQNVQYEMIISFERAEEPIRNL